jgi:hypothetical protein
MSLRHNNVLCRRHSAVTAGPELQQALRRRHSLLKPLTSQTKPVFIGTWHTLFVSRWKNNCQTSSVSKTCGSSGSATGASYSQPNYLSLSQIQLLTGFFLSTMKCKTFVHTMTLDTWASKTSYYGQRRGSMRGRGQGSHPDRPREQFPMKRVPLPIDTSPGISSRCVKLTKQCRRIERVQIYLQAPHTPSCRGDKAEGLPLQPFWHRYVDEVTRRRSSVFSSVNCCCNHHN